MYVLCILCILGTSQDHANIPTHLQACLLGAKHLNDKDPDSPTCQKNQYGPVTVYIELNTFYSPCT